MACEVVKFCPALDTDNRVDPMLYRPIGLEPLSHTPKLNQIEAGQSQPKKRSPVSGPICNHMARGQASCILGQGTSPSNASLDW